MKLACVLVSTLSVCGYHEFLPLLQQISDAIYYRIQWYHSVDAGRAISSEFALFTTTIVCVLGGGAFLISSLTVEADRAVSTQSRP